MCVCVWAVGLLGGEAAGKGAGLAHQTQATEERGGCTYYPGVEESLSACLPASVFSSIASSASTSSVDISSLACCLSCFYMDQLAYSSLFLCYIDLVFLL